MKKIVGIVIGVLVLAVVIYMIIPKGGVVVAGKGLENYVPKEAVAFYSIKNLESSWKDIKNSDFWKQLQLIPAVQNLNAGQSINALTSALKANLGVDINEKTVMDLIGKDLAIAIVVGARNDPEPKVIVLANIGSQKTASNTVNSLISKAKSTAGTSVSNWKYSSVEFTNVKSTDPTAPELNYALINNTLVLGVGKTKSAVEKVADLVTGKSKDSIAHSKGYAIVNKLAAGAGRNIIGTFYMDFEKISQTVGKINLPIPGGAVPANLGAPLSILKNIGGVTWIDQGIKTKIIVTPNKANMDETTRTLWDVKPKKAESLAFVPEGTVLYSVSNSLDVAGMWKMWKSNIAKQAPDQSKAITDALANAEQTMGMSIENDILAWIGDEIAYTFNEVNVEGVFPIPKMSLIVKVKDEEKARTFLRKLVDLVNERALAPAATAAATTATAPPFQLNLEKTSYSGVEIDSIMVPLVGKGLSPGYAVIDGFLVISTSAATLEKMIDISQKKGTSLTNDVNFKKVSSVVSGKVNQMGYINTEKIFDTAIDICNWVISFQQLNIPGTGVTPDQINATRSMLSETVIPVLRCLKAVKVVGISTIYTEDGIEQNISTRIDDI
ncbi:MAG: DUF3352 domain-containing protein [Candidatus Ancaeobacter aquaticus]|nr:DUF3352 domain-containing protein [Candidatus Ancaeobacter aquaticus]